MGEFLDASIIKSLRDTINSTNLFDEDDNYKYTDFNFICAVMDRVDTCVMYLNNHSSPPRSEENFISFLMFSSMLVDAVKLAFRQFGVTYPYSDLKNKSITIEQSPHFYEHFGNICLNSILEIDEENCPTDDKFFEYLRSLSFAHPVDTSRAKFLEDDEIHYSPWVIVNKSMSSIRVPLDCVGVRIYTNKSEEILDFTFSFSSLKCYINSRYELFNVITFELQERINKQVDIWKKRKVNRNLSDIDILHDIQSILAERYETDSLDELISCLSCELSNECNTESVNIFRRALVAIIPTLCDSIDEMDYEKSREIKSIMRVRPKKVHEMFHYQMEKIFSYLNDGIIEESYEFGLMQANEFSLGFAKKWVTINTDTMINDEIKLLVRTACYLEWLEQEKTDDKL